MSRFNNFRSGLTGIALLGLLAVGAVLAPGHAPAPKTVTACLACFNQAGVPDTETVSVSV